MKVGTEGLGLFAGAQLRDAALAQSALGRETRIQQVRQELERWLDNCEGDTITADDIFVVAEQLGLTEGDTRWLGNVPRGWVRMRNTGRYEPSTLPQRHARPVAVWKFLK